MAFMLRVKFTGADDKKLSWTFPFVNTAIDGLPVKTLMNAMIANGDIFAEPPLTKVGAEFVVNNSIPIDLNVT